MSKTIVGLVEEAYIYGPKERKKLTAKIDTGATKSSIDFSLAKRLNLGPVLRMATVKSALGRKERGLIKAGIKIAGRAIRAFFTIADRRHMKYKVLVGQNILKRGFLIDPSKK